MVARAKWTLIRWFHQMLFVQLNTLYKRYRPILRSTVFVILTLAHTQSYRMLQRDARIQFFFVFCFWNSVHAHIAAFVCGRFSESALNRNLSLHNRCPMFVRARVYVCVHVPTRTLHWADSEKGSTNFVCASRIVYETCIVGLHTLHMNEYDTKSVCVVCILRIVLMRRTHCALCTVYTVHCCIYYDVKLNDGLCQSATNYKNMY